jgi:aspartate ammonia-lyase
LKPEGTSNSGIRIEQDLLGEVAVPANRLFGAQTQRATENFPLSRKPISELIYLIVALAEVKKACAIVNSENGEIAASMGAHIVQSCDEVIGGEWREEFPIDVLQGGAGTSTNMNMNEVLANRALVLAGFELGRYDIIHPNDHVNRNQSTNDAYATAVRIACYRLNEILITGIDALAAAFEDKATAFAGIRKLGRTQLQDAVAITLADEFRAFAHSLAEDAQRGQEIGHLFTEVNLGGTAVGTGIGASRAYCDRIIPALAKVTGIKVVRSTNLHEASWDMGLFVLYSGFLKRLASKISKICNDLRLLASGPRGGLGEIILPGRQAGSSLMPGKVNPVIPEAVNQVAFRVFGLDVAITFAAEGGQLQLNAFEPLIIASLHEGIELLAAAMDMLRTNCIVGLEADRAQCESTVDNSLAGATQLVSELGYVAAAEIAKLAQHNRGSLDDAVQTWMNCNR